MSAHRGLACVNSVWPRAACYAPITTRSLRTAYGIVARRAPHITCHLYAPQVGRPVVLKWLAAICMINCVGAAAPTFAPAAAGLSSPQTSPPSKSCRESAFEELASMTNVAATARPSAFSWEDIRTGSNATCGKAKCYFPSASANCKGYLISGNDTSLPPLSWLHARCLANRYGLKHLLRAPEERIDVSTQMAYYLGSVHKAHYNLHRTTRALLGVHSGDQLTVQKVQTAPPGLLVGCVGHKLHSSLDALASFASTVTSAHAVGHLNASLESTRQLLLNEHCLTADLQFIISSDGDVIHIDLDRALACKQHKAKMATIDNCFQTLVHSLAALVITHVGTAPTEPRGALTCG